MFGIISSSVIAMEKLSYGLLQNILEHLEKIPNISDEKMEDYFKVILETMDSIIKEKNRDETTFTNWVINIWKHPLFFLEAFISISKDILGMFLMEFIPEQDFELFDVIRRMHGRACLVSEEVLLLLKNGYADGAMSRWRTLHEINVITKFIHQNGNTLAKRYLDSEVIDSKQILRNYERYENKLGLIPLTDDEINDLENIVEEYKKKYGKEFDNLYGWAKSVFPKGRITIPRIEKKVNLSYLRPYYQMACHPIHAGIKGVMFQLGLLTIDEDHILTGQTDMGLADPGMLTVHSLNILNKILLLYINQEKSNKINIIIDYLEEEISNSFCEINIIQNGHDL